MNKNKQAFLRCKADYIRDDLIRVAIANNAGHIAPSLSCVDILVALYYGVMSYKPADPQWENRDRLIFSKSHGCYGLYAVLADRAVMPKNEWEDFNTVNSTLSGCVERRPDYGLEAGCGSLGHGLPMAVGVAFGAKLRNKKYHTFCIVGDGELQEGSNWEALQFAVKHKVKNLTVIVDANGLQAMDFITDVLDIKETDMFKRFSGFGLSPIVCPGHDVVKLAERIDALKLSSQSKPKIIIAKTKKGYGLKCMENISKFHYRIPTQEEVIRGKSYGGGS